MKPVPSRAATARVLADIDAAVRPVERARTAAAVDRVLATAMSGETCLGPAEDCDCHVGRIERCNATPGLIRDCSCGGDCELADHVSKQAQRYAPHNVSPHLFPTDPS